MNGSASFRPVHCYTHMCTRHTPNHSGIRVLGYSPSHIGNSTYTGYLSLGAFDPAVTSPLYTDKGR
jgi:hypothetical protein